MENYDLLLKKLINKVELNETLKEFIKESRKCSIIDFSSLNLNEILKAPSKIAFEAAKHLYTQTRDSNIFNNEYFLESALFLSSYFRCMGLNDIIPIDLLNPLSGKFKTVTTSYGGLIDFNMRTRLNDFRKSLIRIMEAITVLDKDLLDIPKFQSELDKSCQMKNCFLVPGFQGYCKISYLDSLVTTPPYGLESENSLYKFIISIFSNIYDYEIDMDLVRKYFNMSRGISFNRIDEIVSGVVSTYKGKP